MSRSPIVPFMDNFVEASKNIEGTPEWREVGFSREYRLVAPLSIDGISTGVNIEVNAYPNIATLRFRILLLYHKCFARLDFVDDEQHVNPLGLGDEFPKGIFWGPHIHHWHHNKSYCTTYGLPDRLRVAIPLPERLRQFDATLRWFCSQYRISQPPSGLIALPTRTSLL